MPHRTNLYCEKLVKRHCLVATSKAKKANIERGHFKVILKLKCQNTQSVDTSFSEQKKCEVAVGAILSDVTDAVADVVTVTPLAPRRWPAKVLMS